MQSSLCSHLQQTVPWWNDLTPAAYAALHLPSIRESALRETDVIVIGGGVAGLSTALALKERNRTVNVLVIEKEEMLGCGATGQNAGILGPGINLPLSDIPSGHPARTFYPATTEQFHRLFKEGEKPGALLSVAHTGAISLAESVRAAHKLEREVRARQSVGLRAELWSPALAAEATLGRLNMQSVICAMWLPDEGRIQPLTLLAHLAQQARHLGVEIAGQASVLHYEQRKDQQWQLSLADETTLFAHGLVSCVGPTVKANARTYALAFEAIFPESFPVFWNASPYTYIDHRPGHGRLGVTGGRYGKAGVRKNDTAYHDRIAEMARRWLPELAEKQPKYRWAVDLAVAADLIPEMRVLAERAPGASIEGLGAHGVLPSMVLAERTAEFIMDRL